MRTCYTAYLIFLFVISVHAQEMMRKSSQYGFDASENPSQNFSLSNFKYGFYLSGNLNHHFSNFPALPSIPNCCIDFRGNDALGYSGGGLLDYSLNDDFTLELRAGYINQSVRLHEENFIGNAIIGNEAIPSYSEHSIDTHLAFIELLPQVRYKIFNSTPLYLHGGFSFGAMISKSYVQKEILLRPPGITFNNGLRERNVFTGDLPDALTFQPSIIAGASYDFQFSSVWSLSPEIQVTFPLRSIIDNLQWHVNVFKFGVAMRMNVEREMPPSVVKQEPEKPPEHFLKVKLDAVAIHPDGRRDKDVQIQIDEIRYTEMYPLLPYIFFPENNADLYQTRMHLLTSNQAQLFDETKLPPSTMNVYADLLNIAGKRLLQFPKASITIIGCNNNTGIESSNLKISNDRAQEVKKYFVDIWKIDPKRIRVAAQNLPSMPTKNDITDGQVENRRAEIIADDFNILAPVRIEEIKRKQSLAAIEFVPEVKSSSQLQRWDLRIQQSKNILHSQSGEKNIDTITWYPDAYLNTLTLDEINAVITIQNEERDIQSSEVSLPVTIHHTNMRRYEMRHNIRIEKYGLILFDFDKAIISGANKRILDSVKSSIKANSKVIIQGYADRTGTKEYNKSLAAARCQSVSEYLKDAVADNQVILEPIGSDQLIFYNELPEERNYNRIVYITIETPE